MFSGELDRSAYAWQVALRGVLCFVVAPLVLLLLTTTICTTDKSACFAVSIFTGMFSAHAVYVLFALSCISIIIRRLRRLELPIFLVALPILFFLADLQNGAFFVMSLAMSVLTLGASAVNFGLLPRNFLLALVCLLALWILPDRERTAQSQCERWGIPGLMTLGVMLLMAIGATLAAIQTVSLKLLGIAAHQIVMGFMRYYYTYGSAVIFVVLVMLTARWQKRVSSKA